MRGNPIVELIATLIMLASVLVGGAYWGVYKQEHKVQKKEENVLQAQKKADMIDSPVKTVPLTFETAVKTTE